MITFILGALAAISVGVIVWLVLNVIKMIKQVKHLEEQKQKLWLEIQVRCDSIERELNGTGIELNNRIDSSISYTDSRLDKLVNYIERDYVTKKNRADNTIEYNN
jgi:predicted PurR-regulated permease PerM